MPDVGDNQEEILSKIISTSLASQLQEEDNQQKPGADSTEVTAVEAAE